jgi:hypothetical protein
MKLKFCFNLAFVFSPLLVAGQTSFAINPYVNGVTSIKDGFIEAGPEFTLPTGVGLKNVIRVSARLPFSDKETNTVTVDRSLQSWRGVLSYAHDKILASTTGPVSWFGYGLQAEYGRNQFKYYPTGMSSVESASSGNSVAGEAKLYAYTTPAAAGATQHSFQLRLRFSSEFKGADEVGVAGPPNANGLITTTNMVVEAPSRKTTFSPAMAYQYYGGAGKFSYTPALYFDRKGGNDEDSPFVGGVGRYRAEFWIFYYPSGTGIVNVKMGLAPYISIRAVGTDKLNAVEFGGQLSLKTNSNFMNFFN